MIQNKQGFSLVEILVALTLLGLVGTFVAGRIFEQLHQGNVKAAQIQMAQFRGRLQEFRHQCGHFPSEEQGLEALVSRPAPEAGRECRDYPEDGFIEGGSIPLDPWNNEYVYLHGGKNYNIVARGADGLVGGEDEDADIYLREPREGEEEL